MSDYDHTIESLAEHYRRSFINDLGSWIGMNSTRYEKLDFNFAGRKILDIGAGNANLYHWLSYKGIPFEQYLGLECVKEAVEFFGQPYAGLMARLGPHLEHCLWPECWERWRGRFDLLLLLGWIYGLVPQEAFVAVSAAVKASERWVIFDWPLCHADHNRPVLMDMVREAYGGALSQEVDYFIIDKALG